MLEALGLIYGALFLQDSSPDHCDTAIIRMGLLALGTMNTYAFWHLAAGPPRPDQGLIMLGIGVGSIASILYVWVAQRGPARLTLGG